MQLANGTVVKSNGRTTGVLQVGLWRGLLSVQVLVLPFDLVLGLPWLKQCGPWPDWSTGKLFWQRKARLLELPIVVNTDAIRAGM